VWHAWGRGKVFTGFWLGGLKVRDHCEVLDVCGRIILSWTLGKQGSMW
jgi:transposase InsO family protein